MGLKTEEIEEIEESNILVSFRNALISSPPSLLSDFFGFALLWWLVSFSAWILPEEGMAPAAPGFPWASPTFPEEEKIPLPLATKQNPGQSSMIS